MNRPRCSNESSSPCSSMSRLPARHRVVSTISRSDRSNAPHPDRRDRAPAASSRSDRRAHRAARMISLMVGSSTSASVTSPSPAAAAAAARRRRHRDSCRCRACRCRCGSCCSRSFAACLRCARRNRDSIDLSSDRSAMCDRSCSAARSVEFGVGRSPDGWFGVFCHPPLSYLCQVPSFLRYTLPSFPA